MQILFYLGHPAHYHLFKNIIRKLNQSNHKTVVIIKKKDILEELLRNDGMDYFNILPEGRKNNKFSILWGLLKRDWRLAKIVRKEKIDMMIGTEPSLAHVGRLFSIPTLTTVEDDFKVIPYFAYLTYPFTNWIIAPTACDVGKWSEKKISYHGYQKLAYLHPNHFDPKTEILKHLLKVEDKYFLLRFAALTAHHDFGKEGLNTKIVRELISILSERGRIFISSERELEPEFERYRIQIKPNDIHHVLYHAEMYIGDSQSMAVEAAVLGVPSLRFNDFAGKIGVLEELEHRYQLTYGIKTSDPEKLYSKVRELFTIPNLKKEWHKRKQKMISDKIDVTSFLVWFIENYPKSGTIMKTNPSYQFSFK